MPAKINGVNLSDLVKREVEKSVQLQTSELNEMKCIMQAELDTAHQLLLGALARISYFTNFSRPTSPAPRCCPLHRRKAAASAVIISRIGAHMVIIASFPMMRTGKARATSNQPTRTWKDSLSQPRSTGLSKPKPGSKPLTRLSFPTRYFYQILKMSYSPAAPHLKLNLPLM